MLPRAISDTIAVINPTVKAPDDGVSVSVNPGTGRSYNLTFTWERYGSSKITAMQLQIATDVNFDGIISDTTFDGITTDTIAQVVGPTGTTTADYNPGGTYYWRVRVASTDSEGNALATPMWYSPWSATRNFTIMSPVSFTVTAPVVGATEVSVTPTISWSAYEGAVKYEVQVSEDPTFAILDSGSTTANPFFLVDEPLKKSTAYYWRTRAITQEAYQEVKTWIPAITSPWLTGMFVTMGDPVVEEPLIIVEKEPAQPPEVKVIEVPVTTPSPVPAALLWAIIVIGAVLVIALIVLIVRTRRVT
jgi:hypothetical protein